MVPDVNEEIPVPAFEYFVETTRAFLNMAQNDIFTTPNMLALVVPAPGTMKKRPPCSRSLRAAGRSTTPSALPTPRRWTATCSPTS